MNNIPLILTLLGLAVVAALLIRAALRRDPDALSDPGHNHDHGKDGCGCHGDDATADNSEFHAVHHGKDTRGGCKFDPEIVRRTHLRPPRRSTSPICLLRTSELSRRMRT